MYISRIELRDFRNIQAWSLEPHRALTVLVGPNAAGKTNTVEAIQTICTGTSFRKPRWPDLVRWGSPSTQVQMIAEGEIPKIEVSLVVELNGDRTWSAGGVRKRRLADATRFVPVVTFTPDDLSMVKGPAEQRRASLDTLAEQLSVVYGALRRDYARVVRQRNSLLRDNAHHTALEPWNTQLVDLGSRLYTHRRRLLKRLVAEMSPLYASLSGGELLSVSLVDRCGIGAIDINHDIDHTTAADALHAHLCARSHEERSRGVTLIGPHRDDIVFSVDGRDARSFASQGQQRTVALAWKLAEVRVVTTVLSRTPVLLLDDVMSELDAARRAALTDLIQQDIQTFVTTTNTGYFDPALLNSALVVPIEVQS